MVHEKARSEDGSLLKSVADQIAGRTICAFGEACSWPTQSFLAKFGDEFKNYTETKQGAPAPATLI
jgi:NADH-quinone oxidoreductase subunit F